MSAWQPRRPRLRRPLGQLSQCSALVGGALGLLSQAKPQADHPLEQVGGEHVCFEHRTLVSNCF